MKNKISAIYPHHHIDYFSTDLFVVDYTNQTGNKREVEINHQKPNDINSFSIKNPLALEIGICIFDNKSFIDSNNDPLTHCECVGFPSSEEIAGYWVLFLELKYCKYENGPKKIREAKEQVFATREHYKKAGVINEKQLCYLVVSLPKQNNSPFENFCFTQSEVLRLKRDENIIFRGVNELTIVSENVIFL